MSKDGLSISLVQDFGEKALVPKLNSYEKEAMYSQNAG